jgi:hypothetical protein
MAPAGSELFIVGDFKVAGATPSERVALWHIPHSLKMQRVQEAVTLSWPATGTNFLLEAAPQLLSTNWSTVPDPYNIHNDQCVVTEPLAGTNQFYRLRRR